MRSGIFLTLMLGMLTLTSVAQQLPACIAQLNRKTDLTTTKFERVIQLKGNRTVYEFSVKSTPQCIDCHNGTIFYDGNCNVIASFMKGRGAGAYVGYDYTAEELGKAAYPDVRYGVKKDSVASCIEKVLSNTDSLTKAGLSKVVQVRMKGKVLYGFEHRLDPKLANCKDCPRSIVYYDGDCKQEVTFRIGGIAGIKGDKDYTASDFSSKSTLKIVWNSNDVKGANFSKNVDEPRAVNLPKYYTIGKNWFSDFEVFKTGDIIGVSSRDGLKQFRNGKVLNAYKIIPQQVTEHQSSPSKPNVIVSKQHLIYYIEPFNRYFRIGNNGFMVTKAKYLQSNALKSYNKVDWIVAFSLK